MDFLIDFIEYLQTMIIFMHIMSKYIFPIE